MAAGRVRGDYKGRRASLTGQRPAAVELASPAPTQALSVPAAAGSAARYVALPSTSPLPTVPAARNTSAGAAGSVGEISSPDFSPSP